MVNFKDGPQLIQGGWLTQDKKYAAWPPTAHKMDQNQFDLYLQSGAVTPDAKWNLHPVLKIRACSGELLFKSYVFQLHMIHFGLLPILSATSFCCL